MNISILSGRVASDMETRSAGQSKVTKFRLITSERINGEERTETHMITVFGEGSAKYLNEHVRSGDYVELRGRIHYDRYEKEGVTRYTTEIVVDGNVTRVSQAQKNRS